MAIAIVRDGGRYTGMVGQILTGRRSTMGPSELLVISDDVPLIEIWRRVNSKHSGEYLFLDRGVVVTSMVMFEENDVRFPAPESEPSYFGQGPAAITEAGFKRVPDLEAVEERLLDFWSTSRAEACRAWLRGHPL